MASKKAQQDGIVGFEQGERPAKFWQLMGPNFASEEVRKCLPTLHDEPENDVWFVVENNGKAVSFAALRFTRDGKTATLAHHWASDGCRGRGYAKSLTDARIAYALSKGVKRVRAVVHEDSVPAFERLGFTIKVKRAQFSTMEREIG